MRRLVNPEITEQNIQKYAAMDVKLEGVPIRITKWDQK